jgi:capsular exopolysaccharide synthesis family protein
MSEDSLKRILSVLCRLGLLETSIASPPEIQSEPAEWDKAVIKRSNFPFEQLVPQVMNAVSNQKLEIRQNASSFISEQFKNLKVRISQTDSEIPIKVLAVSSPESQEGKSLVSANLAFAFSMDPGRRVVVMDCDLRNPSLDKYLGVALEPGLLGYLAKGHLGPHCFMRRLENLYFLTTGGTAANAIELLSLDKMKELISYLKTEFDTIILDAPPFSPIADARVISGLSDAMVLVVRRGKTSYNSLEKAHKLVDRNKLLGVVFNDVKPLLFNTYYPSGYYQYGQKSRYPYSGHRKARSTPKNYLES